jgi:putative two-component system response regulator
VAETLTALRSILQDYFDIRLAKSAKMALALLQNTTVDMILLDIEMPGVSGFQFLAHLHTVLPPDKRPPVIFVTSHAETDFINQAINSGARDYIVKPIKADILLKKIDSVIGLPKESPAPHPLEEKLHALMNASLSGDSRKVEILLEETRRMAEGMSPTVCKKLTNIEELLTGFEYETANRKIKDLLTYIAEEKPERAD